MSTRSSTPQRAPLAAGYNPWWSDAPEQWDTLVLQGQALPGLAVVGGPGLGRKLDVQSPPGGDGATIVDKGYEPAEIEVRIRMWTADQFDAYEQTNLQILARRGRQRTPLSITHPVLNALGVRQVYLKKVSPLTQESVKGIWTYTLTFVEFSRVTPSRSSTVVTPNTLGNRASFGQNPTTTNPAQTSPSATGAGAPSPNLAHP